MQSITLALCSFVKQEALAYLFVLSIDKEYALGCERKHKLSLCDERSCSSIGDGAERCGRKPAAETTPITLHFII